MKKQYSCEYDCDYYEKGKCLVLGCKCKDVSCEDCPVEIDAYDPYFAGDCDEF